VLSNHHSSHNTQLDNNRAEKGAQLIKNGGRRGDEEVGALLFWEADAVFVL
jgi:hypothetical protein